MLQVAPEGSRFGAYAAHWRITAEGHPLALVGLAGKSGLEPSPGAAAHLTQLVLSKSARAIQLISPHMCVTLPSIRVASQVIRVIGRSTAMHPVPIHSRY